MGVTFLLIPIVVGLVVIISALASFAFIFRRLKINHIIKKLLLFATVQQAIGFGVFVSSNISHASGFKNQLTCFLAITSVQASIIRTQTSISAISIIRYSFKDSISFVYSIFLGKAKFVNISDNLGCPTMADVCYETPRKKDSKHSIFIV